MFVNVYWPDFNRLGLNKQFLGLEVDLDLKKIDFVVPFDVLIVRRGSKVLLTLTYLVIQAHFNP